jgi:hypothetical protein
MGISKYESQTDIVKKIKQYQEKWLPTRTEDGHKQNTKTSITI